MRTSEFLIRFFFHPAKKKRKERCHTASHAWECVKYCSIWSKSLILQIFSGGTNMYSDTSLLAFDFVPWIVSYLAHSLLTPRHLLRTLPRTLINMKHVIVFFWCHLQRWMPLIIWDKCCVASCGRSSLSFTQVNPANPQYKLQILFIWSTAHCSFWEHLVFIQQDRTVLLYLYLISWQDRPNDSSPEKGRCPY